MKLVCLRLCNFRSFGPTPTEIALDSMIFLLGPNGTGKTAVLQALARLFSIDPAQRRVKRSDFHVPADEDPEAAPGSRELWIEADFELPELVEDAADGELLPAVPVHFAHMQLVAENGPVTVRFRLSASLDDNDEIEESLTFVITVDADNNPVQQIKVDKQERSAIQVHYLPANRNPSDHISYSANALLGRALRAADWSTEREQIRILTGQISESLEGNAAIDGIAEALAARWGEVHKGSYFSDLSVSFGRNEIESLLRHLSIHFTPGHGESLVDFSRLSDGQRSLLYLSLVLAMQDIGRRVLNGELGDAFDVEKLRPAVFTLIAVEEPENSLSPHYLGRVVRALTVFSGGRDAQAVVATHSASLLRRTPPESIRYLRLNEDRETVVKSIELPENEDAYKFVREGVHAFPELYFARLVVLGEGASEEIVLPRLLEARGILADNASIAVVPLGGRHVNHFWRLLHGLGIPHVTLLDLDLARYHGGWGRIKYAANQLLGYAEVPADDLKPEDIKEIPAWDNEHRLVLQDDRWIPMLERFDVFYSTPLDLDYMMMKAYPEAYAVEPEELEDPNDGATVAVLGKKHRLSEQYSLEERRYFDAYHTRFKLGSKPDTHLRALANLSDEDLLRNMPEVLVRMCDRIEAVLQDLPE